MAVKINKGSTQVFDLTPMIDCVFQLLIFFLVATRFAEEEREMEMKLAEASAAKPLAAAADELFINIDRQGHYFVGGKLLTLDELYPVLKQAWINNPARQRVIIRADRRCYWEYVVAAMNVCSRAKIRDYRVTTREGP